MDFTPIDTGGGGDFAARRSTPGRAPTEKIEELEASVERLLLITEALWGILKEKHGYEEEELVRRIALIDMQDGKYDHRVAKSPPKACPKCGRTLGKHRARCLFCGEPVAIAPFER